MKVMCMDFMEYYDISSVRYTFVLRSGDGRCKVGIFAFFRSQCTSVRPRAHLHQNKDQRQSTRARARARGSKYCVEVTDEVQTLERIESWANGAFVWRNACF